MKKMIFSILFIVICILQDSFGQENNKEQSNGWYHVKDVNTNTLEMQPIVTIADFETVTIDSAVNLLGNVTYFIIGKIKKDKIHIWADATEKSIGKQIGFLFGGKIISAPQVNQRIENGNFMISLHNIQEPEKVYQAICREKFDSRISTYRYWINSVVTEMSEPIAKDWLSITNSLYIVPIHPSIENIRQQYFILESSLYKELQTPNFSSHSSDYMKSKEFIEYKKFIFNNPVSICFMIDGFLFNESPNGLFGYLIDDIVMAKYPKVKSILINK